MPTYEYECESCHARFELEQSMKEAPVTDCPACSGRVRRVFSLNTVIYKGSGFYCTDHPHHKATACPAEAGGGCSACNQS